MAEAKLRLERQKADLRLEIERGMSQLRVARGAAELARLESAAAQESAFKATFKDHRFTDPKLYSLLNSITVIGRSNLAQGELTTSTCEHVNANN